MVLRATPIPGTENILSMERVTRATNAINVLDVFCSCYTVISAVS